MTYLYTGTYLILFLIVNHITIVKSKLLLLPSIYFESSFNNYDKNDNKSYVTVTIALDNLPIMLFHKQLYKIRLYYKDFNNNNDWSYLNTLDSNSDSDVSYHSNNLLVNLKYYSNFQLVNSNVNTYQLRVVANIMTSDNDSNAAMDSDVTAVTDNYNSNQPLTDYITLYPEYNRDDYYNVTYEPVLQYSDIDSIDDLLNNINNNNITEVYRLLLIKSFLLCLNSQSKLTGESLFERAGFSGYKFRHFLNNLGGLIPNLNYLEIGIYNGSSIFSLLFGNNNINAIGIDSWIDGTLNNDNMKLLQSSVIENIKKYNDTNTINVIVDDCWSVNLPDTVLQTWKGRANVYFYDAGHTITDQYLSLIHYITSVEDVFIYIVDDWNWAPVQQGTYEAIELLSLTVVQKIEVATSGNNNYDLLTSFHNGCGIFLLEK